jgi:glycosyltransferase involved in cell wall biosynthesis
VQPSINETFGRTVIEAMACGAPVLAARAGATPEILADAGAYYEGRDVEACAGRIGEILGDDNKRREMTQKGLARAQEFSYDIEVARLVELFHQVYPG